MRTCLMTCIHLWARETFWFDFSLSLFLNLRRTFIFLTCKWELIRKCELYIVSRTWPFLLPCHSRKTWYFRSQEKKHWIHLLLQKFWTLQPTGSPSGRHTCSQCLHVRNSSRHNFAPKDNGMRPTLIKCIGNTNLLWKAPMILLLVAKYIDSNGTF